MDRVAGRVVIACALAIALIVVYLKLVNEHNIVVDYQGCAAVEAVAAVETHHKDQTITLPSGVKVTNITENTYSSNGYSNEQKKPYCDRWRLTAQLEVAIVLLVGAALVIVNERRPRTGATA